MYSGMVDFTCNQYVDFRLHAIRYPTVLCIRKPNHDKDPLLRLLGGGLTNYPEYSFPVLAPLAVDYCRGLAVGQHTLHSSMLLLNTISISASYISTHPPISYPTLFRIRLTLLGNYRRLFKSECYQVLSEPCFKFNNT